MIPPARSWCIYPTESAVEEKKSPKQKHRPDFGKIDSDTCVTTMLAKRRVWTYQIYFIFKYIIIVILDEVRANEWNGKNVDVVISQDNCWI